MAKKASGVNTKVAKTAYNKVKTEMSQLEQHIKSLEQHVALMNKEVWYGGKSSVNWYKKMNTVYGNLIRFHNGVGQFQSALYSQFHKAKSSGIDF